MLDKKIYKNWLFWVLVVLFVGGALYVIGLFDLWGNVAKDNIQKSMDEQYVEDVERKSEELRNAYKNDPYGGDTPEETMDLFIDALEKDDWELASKYYVSEKQDEAKIDLTESAPLDMYIQILKGKSEGVLFDNGIVYGIDYFKNGKQIHFERLILNKETNKWKIRDL